VLRPLNRVCPYPNFPIFLLTADRRTVISALKSSSACTSAKPLCAYKDCRVLYSLL
jgi:hypothetical protein